MTPGVILFNLPGHGHFDMASLDRYFGGELRDDDYPDAAIQDALGRLPRLGN